APGAGAEVGDLAPGAVDPLIDHVAAGAVNAIPAQVDLRAGDDRRPEPRRGGARGGVLEVGPGDAGVVVGADVEVVGGARAQAGDGLAPGPGAQVGDLVPEAVDPLIHHGAGRAAQPAPAQLQPRARDRPRP